MSKKKTFILVIFVLLAISSILAGFFLSHLISQKVEPLPAKYAKLHQMDFSCNNEKQRNFILEQLKNRYQNKPHVETVEITNGGGCLTVKFNQFNEAENKRRGGELLPTVHEIRLWLYVKPGTDSTKFLEMEKQRSKEAFGAGYAKMQQSRLEEQTAVIFSPTRRERPRYVNLFSVYGNYYRKIQVYHPKGRLEMDVSSAMEKWSEDDQPLWDFIVQYDEVMQEFQGGIPS